jgi:hypothetical protein
LQKGVVKPADTVDHVEEHGGNYRLFWFGALRSLCRPCHEYRHGRGNDRLWFGADGWPLPPEQQAERERQHLSRLDWSTDDDSESE